MTPIFHPQLINGPSGDPGLFVDFLHERRALLFDLGDISRLPPRKALRLSHIFISHTHIDHFIGFDQLVRLYLNRQRRLHLFGPPGFLDQMEHRLAGYTWNLVENFDADFTLIGHELHPNAQIAHAEFHCVRRFVREKESISSSPFGIILDEPPLTVRSAFLDHRTPSLAFLLSERLHVNVRKNCLQEFGLPMGPWLQRVKEAVVRGDSDSQQIEVKAEGGIRQLSLGWLKREILEVVPGQKVAYVTDCAYTDANVATIINLAQGADILVIEATFLHAEAERARARSHLTAWQAGDLGRRAGVGRIVPGHFSAKYRGREEELLAEVEQGFHGKG